MSWWLAIVFLMVGVFIGIMTMALCAINSDSRKDGRKWWEDDE